MNFREYYNRKMSFYFLCALALHIPIIAAIGMHFSQPLLPILLLGTLFLSLPLGAYMMNWKGSLVPVLIGVSGMCFSALFIHAGKGMIEMHFHVFIFLALLIAFGLWLPVLAATLTIAVHHLGFFFLLPQSVFNYDASIWIVLFHATFVVIESVAVLFISIKFGQFIDMQDTTVLELEKISKQNTDGVEILESTSRELSESSTSSLQAIESVTSNVTNLNQLIKVNSENAKQAASISQDSERVATLGQSELSDLLKAMSGIADSSRKVQDIIKLIEDIAFQTNLLALNAAVEAARAGEQGKGFAVVADAVRDLAQKSGASASSIVSLISENEQRVQQGINKAEASRKVFEQILPSIQKVAGLNASIQNSSTTQLQAVGELTSNFEEINEVGHRNFEASKIINQTSETLNSDVAKLAALIGQISEKGNKAS